MVIDPSISGEVLILITFEFGIREYQEFKIENPAPKSSKETEPSRAKRAKEPNSS
jgi:hypothetical protein